MAYRPLVAGLVAVLTLALVPIETSARPGGFTAGRAAVAGGRFVARPAGVVGRRAVATTLPVGVHAGRFAHQRLHRGFAGHRHHFHKHRNNDATPAVVVIGGDGDYGYGNGYGWPD